MYREFIFATLCAILSFGGYIASFHKKGERKIRFYFLLSTELCVVFLFLGFGAFAVATGVDPLDV